MFLFNFKTTDLNVNITFTEPALKKNGIEEVFSNFAKHSVIQFVPIAKEADVPKDKFYVRFQKHPKPHM
jgi:hypothetical protein